VELLVAMVVAVVLGATVAVLVMRQQRGAVDRLVAVARDQLGAQTAAGEQALDTRNQLMDQRIDAMHGELDRLRSLVRELEGERDRAFGELRSELARAGRTTVELTRATDTLRQALASPGTRGQWGERMAEDVLRSAGMVEGISYRRQATIATGRPDFTFLLPGDRVVHMDVKFPLDHYLAALDADADADRAAHDAAFLKDVRRRVREVTGRGYIDPATGTLDLVLLFIPNEHVYAHLHQADPDLIDTALSQQVVLCSPLTLFAVLAVLRRTCETAALERRSSEILDLLGSFTDQWERFAAQLDKVGDRLDAARREYDVLTTTRQRQLVRQLDRIDDLRRHGGDDDDAGDVIALRGEGATG
jgi:DNA recombination protein RmuC